MLSTNSIREPAAGLAQSVQFILIQPNATARPNTEFGVPRKIMPTASPTASTMNGWQHNTQSDRAASVCSHSDTFISEVQQVNNGFAPEFGNTTATVFNAITKSGTNGCTAKRLISWAGPAECQAGFRAAGP